MNGRRPSDGSERRVPRCERRGERGIETLEFTGEKVVGIRDEDKLIRSRQRTDQCLEIGSRAKLVVIALKKEFWLGALPQIRKVRAVDRRPQSD